MSYNKDMKSDIDKERQCK